MADDIILKEIETDLHKSIAKLNRINKNDALKTKKEIRKEKKLKQKQERIWNDKQSRKFWTSQMKLNECNTSFYRFYPSNDINFSLI